MFSCSTSDILEISERQKVLYRMCRIFMDTNRFIQHTLLSSKYLATDVQEESRPLYKAGIEIELNTVQYSYSTSSVY